MLKHLQIPVTAFQQNCSIVYCDQTRDAALIDPGGDLAKLIAKMDELKLSLKAIWLTHGHLDHVGATGECAATYNIPVLGPHRADDFWLSELDQQAAMFGFNKVAPIVDNQWLEAGDCLTIGKEQLLVLFVPGHTPGHLALYSANGGVVFVGDVLFAGGIGRTDFPQGNFNQLIDSIRTQLYSLPEQTVVVPGHGPLTTIGREKISNPYVKA